jgi:cyclic beta-1,2-glucan synthetase
VENGGASVLEQEPGAAPPPLFSHEQLESHARRLAVTHAVSDDPRRARPLLPRLDSSAARLADAYRFLSDDLGDVPAVASEDWLRDNYYVVQDQIREVRQDLPRQFYLQLPKLAEGPMKATRASTSSRGS